MSRRLVVSGLAFAIAVVAFVSSAPRLRAAQAAAPSLPTKLTDQEFWALSQEMSEPDGYFRSDNLLSNEIGFQTIIPNMLKIVKPGAVYMGVGPEQNFTYIAALKPRMVFITDIRRGNLHTQLMYKALFDLSADRAEFVSRLFSKKRPEGLTAKSSGADIMNAYWNLQTSDELFQQNLKDIEDDLVNKHGFKLRADDWPEIKGHVYWAFYWYGPSITYNSYQGGGNGGRGGGSMADYASLMMQNDGTGLNRSYLGSEETFQFMKDLEARNMLVPVVGNFAGPKALRAVGKYVRDHGATVGAFYLSNVEQYLSQDGIWNNFCSNVATLPLDDTSTFIYSAAGGGYGGSGLGSAYRPMLSEVKQYCPAAPKLAAPALLGGR